MTWRWEIPAYLAWILGLTALSWVDLRTHRLPRRMIALTAAASLPLLAVGSFLEDEPRRLAGAALGALAYFAVMAVLYAVSRDGLGYGDVRLAPLLGAFLGYIGWRATAVGIIAGFGLGALAGLIGLLTRRLQWRSALPFGPFLCAGAIVGILAAGA